MPRLSPCSDSVSLRLRLPAWPCHDTQLAGSLCKRYAVTRRLPLFVGTRFQVLFHSPLGVLFTFPSRYSSTIGQSGVLSLGGWSPQIPPGFHVPEGTQELRRACFAFVYGALTLSRRPSQIVPLASQVPCSGPTTPPCMQGGLGSSAFARRY